MKVTFKTGSEANYGSTNGELFFASNTKQIMLNGIKYIPKKLSELTNDSGFISSITKSMVEGVLTGNITSHTHSYLPLTGGTLKGNLTCNGSYITMSGGAGAKGYSGYFNNPKRSDRASYSHILGDGYAYGENSISIGVASYAGIRNTDSDSSTYPYLHWQWMDCLQVKEVTSAGDVNCYGAILNNLGGTKDTAKFTVCVDGVCKFYDESKGDNDPTNQFLKFTNTDPNYGRVVVFIVDNDATYNKGLIFGGTTEHPRRMCNLKIGNMILGQGCQIKDVASTTINKKTVYRLAIYWWSGSLSASYDITKATTAMVCTKVNDSNYNGASSYASGYASVASGSYSVASGSYSVASGYSSVASGNYSVASGYYSVASGYYSVASGYSSVASGNYSVAKHEGSRVYAPRGISGANYQTVFGMYNVETSGAVVVGWGSSDTSRKNIFVLDTNGNATFGSGGAGTVTAATFNGNATTASKLATTRKITIGSTYKSFDGSGDIEFTLNSIITQSDTINVGTLNVASDATINGALTVSGDISGELSNKLSITLGSTTTTYDNTDNKSINITPSAIGAAAASHTHSYLPLSGGTMSNTSLVTNLNADLLDGYHASSFYTLKSIRSDQNSIYDLRYNYGRYDKGDYNGTYKDEYPTLYGEYFALAYKDKNMGALMFFDTPLSNVLGHIYVRTRGAGDKNTTYSEWGTLAYLTDNVASSSKWANARTITLTGSVTGSVSIDGSANVSLATTTNHTHTFASLESKPTTLSGYGITDAYTKTETNTELGKYLHLTGGTLEGNLTVPTLTATGGIVLGVASINGSLGIKKYNEGFIGFSEIFGGINGSVPFEGISLGWGSSPETSANSVRINASTFTYKGNSVLHSGNLGYTSSGLSRAVQKDANGNLFIVAPSLFEQGISNNYPKNLRWSNETEGQLVYDTEVEAGNFDTVEIGIPLANGTSKGFLKSISEVTNVTGYTPCPVVSGTPYYKEDCLYLGSTEIGYTGIMEYGIQYTYNYGTKLPYLEDYTPDSIPRCVVLCFPDRSSNYRFLFWLSAFDEGDPYIARFYNSAYETWLTIDTASRQIILSYGNTWQS